MGGLKSKCVRARSKCYHSEESSYPPDLTSKQKQLLKEAWEQLEKDITAVGVITFVGMFKTHPHVQSFFMPFTGLAKSDEHYGTTLKLHALRVMATMEKCIHRLEEPERMRVVLEQLGSRHANYNAKIDYVELLGYHFMLAVKENSHNWSEELENAWQSLIRIVTFFVKKGWVEKQRRMQISKEIAKKAKKKIRGTEIDHKEKRRHSKDEEKSRSTTSRNSHQISSTVVTLIESKPN